MAETENQQPSGVLSLWRKLEKLRHPHFRKRLEGVEETERTMHSSTDGRLVDHLEEELIKLAQGDENPAVRDAAFRQVLKWGGPFALGLSVAMGAAYLGAKVLTHQRRRSKEEIEKIFRNPAAYQPKRVLQVGEEAIHFGRGKEFVENLLDSLSNPEPPLKGRLSLVASINPHSPLGAELFRHEASLVPKMESLPEELRVPLQKLLRQAKATHSEREKLTQLDLKNLH